MSDLQDRLITTIAAEFRRRAVSIEAWSLDEEFSGIEIRLKVRNGNWPRRIDLSPVFGREFGKMEL